MNEECPPIWEVMTENEYQLYLKHNMFHLSIRSTKYIISIYHLFSSPTKRSINFMHLNYTNVMRYRPYAPNPDYSMYFLSTPALGVVLRLSKNVSDIIFSTTFNIIRHILKYSFSIPNSMIKWRKSEAVKYFIGTWIEAGVLILL